MAILGKEGTQSGRTVKSIKRHKRENRKDKIKEILQGKVSLGRMVSQIEDIYHGRKFKKGGTVKKKYAHGGKVRSYNFIN